MTIDHVNKYLFNGMNDWMFAVGRLATPIFAMVLAYNLARPSAYTNGVHLRVSKRLLIFGTLATIPYIMLGGVVDGWWPLNILFMLLGATLCIYLIEKGGVANYVASILIFAGSGAFVEFWWPALAFTILCQRYFRGGQTIHLFGAALALASLYFVNKNMWAMLAIPIILVAPRVDVSLPRVRHVFYAYYPAHLIALLLIRIPMRKMGFLFFT